MFKTTLMIITTPIAHKTIPDKVPTFTPQHTTRSEGILETAMGVQHSYMLADAAHVKIRWEA
jgi:hypothetical protein